ncbi:14809_t:CDS:2, partial [Gigaspora rosea]
CEDLTGLIRSLIKEGEEDLTGLVRLLIKEKEDLTDLIRSRIEKDDLTDLIRLLMKEDDDDEKGEDLIRIALKYRGETNYIVETYDESISDLNDLLKVKPGDAWAKETRRLLEE